LNRARRLRCLGRLSRRSYRCRRCKCSSPERTGQVGVVQTNPAEESTATGSAAATPNSAGTVPSSAPVLNVVASGSFHSLEHPTTGRAVVLGRSDGTVILRLENLNTSNGPTCGFTSPRSRRPRLARIQEWIHRSGAAQRQQREPELRDLGRHRSFEFQERGHLVPQVPGRVRSSSAPALTREHTSGPGTGRSQGLAPTEEPGLRPPGAGGPLRCTPSIAGPMSLSVMSLAPGYAHRAA
jgi:hypothetical protein